MIRGLVALAILGAGCSHKPVPHGMSFHHEDWIAELERPGIVKIADQEIEIDVPAGATLWWKTALVGPVAIEYQAMMIADGGANDRVSDLNCFWMAKDARGPNFFAVHRSGKFADYNELRTYYVGLGGNGNTTTRFRRYIGSKDERPLLPQHDLSAAEFLLKPNVWQSIKLVADESTVQYWRDGKMIFDFSDPAPYTRGYFGFRTTQSHLKIRAFRVRALSKPLLYAQPKNAPLKDAIPR